MVVDNSTHLIIDDDSYTLYGNKTYEIVEIRNSGTLNIAAYNGTAGTGVLNITASKWINVTTGSMINGRGKGYPGGAGVNHGDGATGQGSLCAGGGGRLNGNYPEGGGGAGNGGVGGDGGAFSPPGGVGGTIAGTIASIDLRMGCGGGGGGGEDDVNDWLSGAGGSGGGAVIISAHTIKIHGTLDVDGNAGGDNQGGASGYDAGGGGGSGGSVILDGNTVDISQGYIYARGGSGGLGGDGGASPAGGGGGGGGGRIKIFYWSLDNTSLTYSVAGGAGGSGDYPGEEGSPSTIYYEQTNQPPSAPTSITLQGSPPDTPGILHLTNHTPNFTWAFSDPDDGDLQGAWEIEVHTDASCSYPAEKWDTEKLVGSDSSDVYAGTNLSDGSTYYLRIRTWDSAGAEGPWSSCIQFHMNSKPSIPTGLSPTDRQTSNSIEFSHAPSTDAENDSIKYYMEVEEVDSTSPCPGFSSPYFYFHTGSSSNITGPQTTYDGKKYCFRVRSHDGYEYSPWSSTAWVIENDEPPAPASWLPTSTHDTAAPASWTEGTDADGDPLTQEYCVDTSQANAESFTGCNGGGGIEVESPQVLTLSYEGASKTYYYALRSSDGYENGSTLTGSFTLVNSRPSPPSSASLDGGRTSETSPAIDFVRGTDSDIDPVDAVTQHWSVDRANHSESGNQCKGSGDVSQFTCTLTAGEGVYYVSMWSDDGTGARNSKSVYYNFTFTLDTTPPMMTIDSPLNTTYSSSSIWFNASLNEAGIVHAQLDEVNYTLVNSSNNWSLLMEGLSEGRHRVEYFANDSTGNGIWSASIHFTVDTEPPYHIEIHLPNNTNSSSTSMSISWTACDATTGLQSDVLVDDVEQASSLPTANCMNTSHVVTTDEGIHNLTVIARDGAGNTNASTLRFVVDVTPPIIENSTAIPGTVGVGNQVTLATGARDSLTGARTAWAVVTDPYSSESTVYLARDNSSTWRSSFSPSKTGTYSVVFHVSDYAGNTNSTKPLDFRVIPSEKTVSVGGVGGGGGGGGVSEDTRCLGGIRVLNTSLLECVFDKLELGHKKFYRVPPILAPALALTGDSVGDYPAPEFDISSQLSRPVRDLDWDAYEVSAKKSLVKWPNAKRVVIARGDIEADSYAAIAYAKALGCPILLTRPERIPSVTMDILGKMGPEAIVLVGGIEAVAVEVEMELAKISRVERIAGRNREETAVELARVLLENGKFEGETIVITDGAFPMPSAALLSALYGAPILYVSGDEVPGVTRDFLSELIRGDDGELEVVFAGVSEGAMAEVLALIGNNGKHS